jgi:hypothetical protein
MDRNKKNIPTITMAGMFFIICLISLVKFYRIVVLSPQQLKVIVAPLLFPSLKISSSEGAESKYLLLLPPAFLM